MPSSLYRAVFDLLPDPILLADQEGKIVEANRALAERLQIQREQLRDRSVSNLVVDTETSVTEFLRRCSRTRCLIPSRLTLALPNGGALACHVEGTLCRRRTEDLPAIVLLRFLPRATIADQITTLNRTIKEQEREIGVRRRSEAELRNQREWLRVTLASIGDGVLATDTRNRVVLMNNVAERLTGWRIKEAEGRPIEEVFHIINEDTRERVENPARRALQEGKIVAIENHTVLISRDGREIPIDDCGAPIRAADACVIGAVLVFHDIAERRRLERELHERANRLAEADARKNEFLAMLSHELRNPLAPLRTGLDIIATRPVPDPISSKVLGMMSRQVQNLSRLIDDLVDVARITGGHIPLIPGRVHLQLVLERSIETARPAIDGKEHRLEVALPEQPLWIEGDAARLQQVFTNLLTNAARFTPRKGLIQIETTRENGTAHVIVRDNGIGIAGDIIDKLFDLFTQADRSLARSEGGLGIGLTMAKKIVEMHGGTIDAQSAGPGRGAEFTVHLALASDPDSPPSPSRHKESAGQSKGGVRVVVVDDNQDAAESLAMMLELFGHEVIGTAYDGPSALKSVLEKRPRVVFLDVGLPEMDGYEVARRIRVELGSQEPFLVAVTGYGMDTDRQRSLEAGFDLHMVKPIDPDDIRGLLQNFAKQDSS